MPRASARTSTEASSRIRPAEGERERDRHTDRQIGRQAGRQTLEYRACPGCRARRSCQVEPGGQGGQGGSPIPVTCTFCRAHRHVSRGEWQGLEGEWLWRVEKSLFVWWRIEGQGILSSIDSNCARRSVCPGSAQRARQQQARVSHGGRPQAGPRTGKTDRRRGGCGG